jgi:hypothetical protein
MSTDEKSTGDAAWFERRLIESARHDRPPDDPEAAWTRFATALPPVATTPQPPAPAPPPAATAAMKWLLLGTIGGASLTAAALHQRPAPPHVAPAQQTATDSIPNPKPAPQATPPPHPRPRAPHHHAASTSQPTASPQIFAPDPSTLIAEVARLDAARAALTRGDNDEALTRIAHYHHDFPQSVLAPDADVVALEALAAKKDWPALKHQATTFLSTYPQDPHTTRVKSLARRH